MTTVIVVIIMVVVMMMVKEQVIRARKTKMNRQAGLSAEEAGTTEKVTIHFHAS